MYYIFCGVSKINAVLRRSTFVSYFSQEFLSCAIVIRFLKYFIICYNIFCHYQTLDF